MGQMEPHVKVAFFGQKVIFSVSDVSERFKGSISRFPTNFKKISESRTFDLSPDPTYHRAKISQFQNMLGFIQCGSLLFGIDQGQKFVAVGAESRYLVLTATNRDI